MVLHDAIEIKGLPVNQEHAAIIERLDSWEDEPQGIAFNEALFHSVRYDDLYSSVSFAEDEIKGRIESLSSELNILSELIEGADIEVIQVHLANSLRLTLRVMCTYYCALSPELALWTKYMENDLRFLPARLVFQLQENEFDIEYWHTIVRESKGIARREGWDNMFALRRIFSSRETEDSADVPTFVCKGGLGIFQLACEELLVGFKRSYTKRYIILAILGELEEVKQAKFELDEVMSDESMNMDLFGKKRIEFSLELTDVFIYLNQLVSLLGLKTSVLISEIGLNEYQKVIPGGSSIVRKIQNNGRYLRWLRYMKKRNWLS